MSERAPVGSAQSLLTRHPYLVAALSAAICFLGLVWGVMLIGEHRARARSAALAPMIFPEKWRGRGAQLALSRRNDLLLMYGSSELEYEMQNRATDVFGSYPTGFAIAPIGDRGFPILSMAVAMGSLGTALRGKRIVVSVAGTWLLGDNMRAERVSVRVHLSGLEVGDVVFRSGLPIELRRRFARDILQYVSPNEIGPFLGITLSCLAQTCAFEPLLPALTPIWLLESLPLRVHDYATLTFKLRRATYPMHRTAQVNWDALEARADSSWRTQSASNPFGIHDTTWRYVQGDRFLSRRGRLTDGEFLRHFEQAAKWEELNLLLTTMQVLGARPLVLVTPLKGVYWDFLGVSAAARGKFYAHLDSAITPFAFPMRDFHEYDGDRNFLSEPRSHLSAKGWAVYDRTINAFYHDSLR
jgi:poly-D-alanine transfer protein DltD